MGKERPRLKLGKRASFVKTHLKELKQENDTWEADFRPLPKEKGQTETHYLGLVVALPRGNPLICFPLVEYTPNVNDLADLLAQAMRRPMTESAHRPRQILLQDNPRWEELFPHMKQLGIEVSIQNELPNVEEVHEDFRRQLRRARSIPLILYTPSPTDVHKAFRAIAVWVQGCGWIEVGRQDSGFVARALDDNGLVFENKTSNTLADALAALEEGLIERFREKGINLE